VLWGYSLAAGPALKAAVNDRQIAAVLTISPFLDGLARIRRSPIRNTAWIVPRAVADLIGLRTTIPATAPPGGHGAMVLPGEADGFARIVKNGSPWPNQVPAAAAVTTVAHRRQTLARHLHCPVWVGIGDNDRSVSETAAEQLATRAPAGELHRYPFDHFDPLAGTAPKLVARDQIKFLLEQGLLDGERPSSPLA
jgi:hypothetical protein